MYCATVHRTFITGLAFIGFCAGMVHAASVPDSLKVKPYTIRANELLTSRTSVPGHGEISGLDLSTWGYGAMRWTTDDDSAFAVVDHDDRLWPKGWKRDSLIQLNAPIYWLRYHFKVDSTVDINGLLISLFSTGKADVWLDGSALLRATFPDNGVSEGLPSMPDSAWMLTFPLPVGGDGSEHVLAMRLEAGPEGVSPLKQLNAVLYLPRSLAVAHRSSVHEAIFLGVNAFIFLMTLIFWRMDKSDKVWPWFAGITAANALMAFGTMLETTDVGLVPDTAKLLMRVGYSLLFVPLSLMVMLLLSLIGTARRSLWRLYIVSAVVINLVGVAMSFNLLGFSLSGQTIVQIIISIAIVVTILGVGIWFLLAAIRLAIRVIRARGYVRWLGIGVLLSLVPVLAIGLFLVWAFIRLIASGGEDVVSEPPELLTTVASYFGSIALPLCIIVALAIRSSFQNRMLARQRDDLDREVHERTAELRLERDRSDNLLLNILPHEVAEELKRTGAAEARNFDEASVLFSDFKDFTAVSGSLAASEVLLELNTCFKAFDGIIAAHGIEKIKTIGDAYMCAGGLPDPKTSSPSAVVFAALEMQEFIQLRHTARKSESTFAFEMRLGIHTGPVVAGIVGIKKFQYDIWGDTVNTAARMETNGEVGRVNISGGTYALVKDTPGLSFSPRGKVVVKGKGEMDMWFAERA